MKPFLAALLTLALLTAPLPAADPAKTPAPETRTEVATFLARVAYAKSIAPPVLYTSQDGTLSCTVYTVKQGTGKTPGYTVVVTTDESYAPIASIVVVSDTTAIDPAHFILCSGHVLSVQAGWFTRGDDGMTMEFGLGKGDPVLKMKGRSKTVSI